LSSQYEVLTGRLTGKVILIVGATSGIGRAVALRVADERATVVVAGRRADLGAQVCDDIISVGAQAVFTPCDATQEGDVAAAVALAIDKFGHLDGAVNNAGGVLAAGPLADLPAADWQAELDLNLNSVFFGLKHQIPAIHASGGGAIINNASTAGVSAVPGLAAYSAAKHGLVGLTKSAALEWADRRVRVNAIVTGNVDTPLYRRLLDASPPTASTQPDWPGLRPDRNRRAGQLPPERRGSLHHRLSHPDRRRRHRPLSRLLEDRMTCNGCKKFVNGSRQRTRCDMSGLGDRTFRKGILERRSLHSRRSPISARMRVRLRRRVLLWLTAYGTPFLA
jgi:NAD(P)-dependent dehydrogenase (short-subunit alcohol dehydrogenase family)